MPKPKTEASDSSILRPHHLEGALRSLMAAVGAPQAAGIIESMEPEEAIAMTFAAEDYLVPSTPAELKEAIQARYAQDPRFQKLIDFLRVQQQKNPEAESIIPKSEMVRILQRAYERDPGATVIFRNVYDDLCAKCPSHFSRTGRPCMPEFILSDAGALAMDDTVIAAIGEWQYDKPYRVSDVLKWLTIQSTRRRIAMLSAAQHADPGELAEWRQDVTAAKKLPVINEGGGRRGSPAPY